MFCPDCQTQIDPSLAICPHCSADLRRGGSRPERRRTKEARIIVGWLVSFSRTPWGESFVIHEGDNVIGHGESFNVNLGQNTAVRGGRPDLANLIWQQGKCWLQALDPETTISVDGLPVGSERSEWVENGSGLTIGNTKFLLYLVTDRHYQLLWPERFEAAPEPSPRRRLT